MSGGMFRSEHVSQCTTKALVEDCIAMFSLSEKENKLDCSRVFYLLNSVISLIVPCSQLLRGLERDHNPLLQLRPTNLWIPAQVFSVSLPPLLFQTLRSVNQSEKAVGATSDNLTLCHTRHIYILWQILLETEP